MKKVFAICILLVWLVGACSPARNQATNLPAQAASVSATQTPPPAALVATEPPTPTLEPTRPLLPTPTLLGLPAAEKFRYRIVAYYPSWGIYARKFSPVEIPMNKITHINYAFGKVDTKNLTCMYADQTADDNNFIDLRRLKQIYPDVKVLLSLGGWTLSDGFSDVALSEASRAKFVKSCIDLYVGWYPEVFDGFDIDWEYPVSGGLASNTYRPEDKHNLTLLTQEFRKQLDELGKKNGRPYLLSLAVPAGKANYANFELKDLAATADWLNLMAFDFHGSWDKTTAFNAPLYKTKADPSPDNNVDAAVQAYLAMGVPPKQLNVGLGFYGRGWSGVGPTDNGLYQAVDGQPNGTYTFGAWDYWDLASNYVYQGDYMRYWDDEAKVPWLYSPKDKVFITYEDPQSISLKADYIRAQDLGGAMLWDISNDDGTLINAVYYHLFTRIVLSRP